VMIAERAAAFILQSRQQAVSPTEQVMAY